MGHAPGLTPRRACGYGGSFGRGDQEGPSAGDGARRVHGDAGLRRGRRLCPLAGLLLAVVQHPVRRREPLRRAVHRVLAPAAGAPDAARPDARAAAALQPADRERAGPALRALRPRRAHHVHVAAARDALPRPALRPRVPRRPRRHPPLLSRVSDRPPGPAGTPPISPAACGPGREGGVGTVRRPMAEPAAPTESAREVPASAPRAARRFPAAAKLRARSSRLSEHPLALWVTAAVLAIVTWPIASMEPQPGLDPSWLLGLHMAAHQGLDFGRDLIFTYGPLGFMRLLILAYVWTTRLAFLATAITQFLFCATLIWGLRRITGSLLVAALATLVLAPLFSEEPQLVVVAMGGAVAL